MLFNKDKDEQLFLDRILKVTPEEFVGLAQVLNVKMSTVNPETGEYAVRDAVEMIEDMVVSFRHCNHKERKTILKAMKK